MALTIIEPHEHVELILALAPALTAHPEPVHLVVSKEVRQQLHSLLPDDAADWIWMSRKELLQSPKNHLCVFTSLQYHRGGWLAVIDRYPSALLIHNLRNYISHDEEYLAPVENTRYTPLAYRMKRWKQKRFDHTLSKHILLGLNATFHYATNFSLTQISFPKRPHFTVPLFYKQKTAPGTYDWLPVYGHAEHLDLDFLNRIHWQSDLRVLCEPEEESQLRLHLPSHATYEHTPLPYPDYHQRFREARRVVVPFQKEIPFGLIHEQLEFTKSLARIHLARQYGKTLVLPPEIRIPPPAPGLSAFRNSFRELVAYLQGIKS